MPRILSIITPGISQQMKIIHQKYIKSSLSLFVAFFILSGQPAEFGEEKTFFHGYLIEKPIIKIGLGVNLGHIRITSSSGMKIYEVNAKYKLVADDADEVYIKGHKEKLTEKFMVQVARTKERDEAESIAEELGKKIKQKIYVTEDTENEIAGSFQVKVGDFLTRGDALGFIKELNQIGIKESWILREEITADESKPLWILVNDELINLHEDTVLYFIPSSKQSFLSFNGRDYRGLFVLKASPKGVVLVNILNLENYLKGVVPSELSPYDFSELEAHKAQAVAARTYAIKKLGMHDDLGFDFSDTPNFQFYKGMNAEHPLSSKAVDMTRGEVALYRGKLIDALYTSTCGGMTENAENIFGGPSLPYLRSTECVYEKQKEWKLKSKNRVVPFLVNGRNISPMIASLISLKIIPQEIDPTFFKETASYQDALKWIEHILALLGKKVQNLSPEASPLNYENLVHLIVQNFGWEERVQNLMLSSEKEYILKDYEEWNGEDGDYLAYLIQSGVFPSSRKLRDPKNLLSRAELAFYLGKVIQSYHDLTNIGVFKKLDRNMIELEKDKESKKLLLSPDMFILRNNDGEYSFASQVYLLGGQRVRWVETEGTVRMLEVIYPPFSNILDRSSLFHRWQVRKSRDELEERINQFYPIGELQDLIPQQRGESNRVVELLIKGSETQAAVKGFKIRRVLDLKETLFVVDRKYDDNGNITHFIFCGKGWGHGVGLCQVGAFGMARAGADYKEILKKYYHDIKIAKIYKKDKKWIKKH